MTSKLTSVGYLKSIAGIFKDETPFVSVTISVYDVEGNHLETFVETVRQHSIGNVVQEFVDSRGLTNGETFTFDVDLIKQ